MTNKHCKIDVYIGYKKNEIASYNKKVIGSLCILM